MNDVNLVTSKSSDSTLKPKVLATICARGGSKGVPRKNIKPLLGKPLIAHTIEQAKAWPLVSHVIVSTDDEEIKAIAQKYGAVVPFLRPPELAIDTVGKIDVIAHALNQAEATFNEKFDFVIDLDVTAPIRRLIDLDNGLELAISSGADITFSVVRARRNPYFNMVERDQEGRVLLAKPLPKGVTARQHAPKVFDTNASIYFYRREFLLSKPDSFWSGKLEVFEMPDYSGFDIDHELDFILVEAIMNHKVKELKV